MARVVIDPVTRIEGHLRIEAEMQAGKVSDAWSSGTMFRGIEIILRDRDPREAWIWAQRICGVCTTVHALASVRSVEDALGVEVPDNARLLRSIIAASQNVQDHVIHFYHLHALDWVDVTGALKADPEKTSQIAQSISDWDRSSAVYFKSVQDRIKTLVASRQLSIFTSGYWGHPAYRLPPEVDLLAVAHYLEALEFQREFIRIQAVLGGKNPHPQTYLVGGMATSMDPNEPQAVINPERIALLRQLAVLGQRFVNQVYLPDIIAIAGFYPEWFQRGEGVGNFFSYGDYPKGSLKDVDGYYLRRGMILNRDLTRVHPVDPSQVTEYVSHSWYDYSVGDNRSLHPYQGETTPKYSGPKPPYDNLDVEKKYSWLKSPRYNDLPMEVGPLARMLVNYASGQPDVKFAVNNALEMLKLEPQSLYSTMGRITARGIEAKIMASMLMGWIDELDNNMARGELRLHAGEMWDPSSWPRAARGVGLHEAPRGSLGHWIEIEDRKIKNYQAVVPTTWNAGPRDAEGKRGPYEASLLETPLAIPSQPLEILRTVHSFDPCLACAVHVLDATELDMAHDILMSE
jgi:hydrogenase large subunit